MEERLKAEWEWFRSRCLREREELIAAEVASVQRDVPGLISQKICRGCVKRLPSTLFYTCAFCREEACPKCVAVLACAECQTKSCEICAIKANWQIWCERCHRTYCGNHSITSSSLVDVCGYCLDADKAQKNANTDQEMLEETEQKQQQV